MGKSGMDILSRGCDNPEINADFEKILTQIPDWQPAIRLGAPASVYYQRSIAYYNCS